MSLGEWACLMAAKGLLMTNRYSSCDGVFYFLLPKSPCPEDCTRHQVNAFKKEGGTKGKDFRGSGQNLRLIKTSFPPEAASTLFRDLWVLERKDEGHRRKARGRLGGTEFFP